MPNSPRSVALLLIAAVISIAPLPARGDAIDAYIRQQMQQLRLPGVALAVVRNGRPLTIRTYGKANLELDAPVTRQTVFELGSLTKQFTAMAVLTLVDEGSLGLDDSVLKHLPELPESWRDITVRHLLTHSAGIQEYLSVPGLPEEAHALTHARMTRLFGERVGTVKAGGRLEARVARHAAKVFRLQSAGGKAGAPKGSSLRDEL